MLFPKLLIIWVVAGTRPIGVPISPGVPWLRIAAALFVCIGVAIGIILLLRQFSGGRLQEVLGAQLGGIRRKSEIEIIETKRASVSGQICLFHYRGTAYLVAITAGSATLIDKVRIGAEDENVR